MRILTALAIGLVVACGGKQGGAKTDSAVIASDHDKTLYDRIGGKDAITALVDEFVTNVMADKRINALFAAADLPNLKKKLVDQLCQAANGPCVYTGKGMKEAHATMNIKKSDFTALVEDLVAAMKKFDVAESEQREILDLLGRMEKDIVTVQ